MPAPRGLAPWAHARRGELLWMALRELIRHSRHFSVHARTECIGPRFDGFDGGSRVPVPAAETGEPVAVGA